MKTQIAIILVLTIVIGIVSAVYSGESVNYSNTQVGLTNITGVIFIGNTSPILYNLTNKLVTIQVPELSDSFRVIFEGMVQFEDDGGASHSSSIKTTLPVLSPSGPSSPIQSQQEDSNNSVDLHLPNLPADNITPTIKINETKKEKDSWVGDISTWFWIIFVLGVFSFLIWIVKYVFFSEPQVANEIIFPGEEI